MDDVLSITSNDDDSNDDIESRIPDCYKSLSISPEHLNNIYKNGGLSDKIKHSKLDNFEVEESLINIDEQEKVIQNATISMSLFVPIDIIDYIIEFELSETQLFIESKAKQIYNNITIFPLKLCREIAIYSGGYGWDGEFWCYRYNDRPLNKYAFMNRVVYWCGNQDVIYCKSDEFCYGERYFVRILIDHKQDEIWCGIMFNDLTKWSSYYREYNQIAYYGGRRRTTNNIKQEFKIKFPKLSDKLESKKKEENTLELEMNIIENKEELMNSDYLWDMAFGIIQGRGQLMSDVLPWYGTGDIIGILVDTQQGIVYFFKKNILIWYIKDEQIKNKKNKCKIFGCTDSTDDTLIYQRILWNQHREKNLQAQIKKLKPKIDSFLSINQ